MASFALCFTGAAMSADELEYDLDIPQLSLDEALKSLARQVDVQLLFPFDLVRTLNANPVKGRYTLTQALAILLEGTGLAGDLTGSGVITISRVTSVGAPEARVGEVLNINKKAGLSATLAAVFSVGAGAQDVDGLTGAEAELGVVTGKVTDARTGANLKGAKVTIEETGQWASTNDLGEFRFVNVPTGSATLTVSYLGYAGQSAIVGVRGDGASHSFALRGGSEIEEIVVFGARSARAIALNHERTADGVSTVVSADLLGNFTGTTISESLRRAAGVAFQRDQNTGDGTNIIVRGLDPDYNTIKFNGVELPDASGVGRSASLGNILTESIESITISKTLLPSQTSAGAGALIEIETKSPLDRDRRFASFSAQHTLSEKDFLDEALYSALLSGTFGDRDQFGLSASAQAREVDQSGISYRFGNATKFAPYLPRRPDGTLLNFFNVEQIDPRTPFPFLPGNVLYPDSLSTSFNSSSNENLTLSFAGAWRPSENHILEFDYQTIETDGSSFGRSTGLANFLRYAELPVEALDGQIERALFWRNQDIAINGLYTYKPGGDTETDILSFRGKSNIGRFGLEYGVGLANGSSTSRDVVTSFATNFGPSRTVPISDELLAPSAVDPVEGRPFSVFQPLSTSGGYRLPLLNDAGFAFFNDTDNYSWSGLEETTSASENDRVGGDFSIHYALKAGPVSYIEAGAEYEKREFVSRRLDQRSFFYYDTFRGLGTPPLTAGSLGLEFDGSTLDRIGIDDRFRAFSEQGIAAFLEQLENDPQVVRLALSEPWRDLGQPGDIIERVWEPDQPRRRRNTQEEDLAYYLESKIEVGPFELIGGARVTDTRIESTAFRGPAILTEEGRPEPGFFDANAALVTETVSQVDVLPRLLANYRVGDNLVFRAGYYLSVSRPRIELLTDQASLTLDLRRHYGPDRDQLQLFVSKGNPDLKPAKTHSYDFSAEWYFNDVGVLKIGAFYKRIDNLLEASISNGEGILDDVIPIFPDDPRYAAVIANPGDYDLRLSVPTNSPFDADIWGAEVTIEKQLSFLPGRWSSLGIYANYTYTESERDREETWFFPPPVEDGQFFGPQQVLKLEDLPFNQDPKESGTFGLTYSDGKHDASLLYTWQDRRQENYARFNLAPYEEAYDTLDVRIERRFETGFGSFRVFIQGEDLLRGVEDASVQSTIGGTGPTPKFFTGENFIGGRAFSLGLSAAF